MIVSSPVFEWRKWLTAFGVALIGHLSFVWFFADKTEPVSEPLALSAVMLEFADLPQSATKIEPIAIGLPQEMSQESVASASEPVLESPSEPPEIVVEESPKENAEIVVKKQPKVKEKPKEKTKPKEKITPEPKKVVQKVVKKSSSTAKTTHNTTQEREVKENASEVNAQYSSSTSAPPQGESSKNAAPSNTLSENRSLTQSWKAKVLGHLMRYQRYPQFALENNIEGTALTAIRIDRQGNVLDVQINRSSGANILDTEALSLAKRASPLPVPPPHLFKGESIVLPIPLLFDIKAYKKAKRQSN